MGYIREPIKKTSIEKKNRIIEKGFELICDKGYHNVSTVDIAKFAGVSTGIIYQYFQDKRDIFIEGVKDYADKIMFPMLEIIDNNKVEISSIEEILDKMIDIFIKSHTMAKKAHEELIAMSHLDEEIADLLNNKEIELTNKFLKIFVKNNIKISKENIHLAYGIVDNFCHEVVYHKHEELDYELMKKSVIKIVVSLIK